MKGHISQGSNAQLVVLSTKATAIFSAAISCVFWIFPMDMDLDLACLDQNLYASILDIRSDMHFSGQPTYTLLLFLKTFKKTAILIDIKVVRIYFQSVMYSEVCLTDWILCHLRFFLIRISLLIEFFYFFYVTMHSEVYCIQLWLL